ncbi:hypothetical protein GGI24_004384 [Coemansia furcata]|nr:hypothetical protein GGI24_004384 [Coemansia furcata]
MSHNDSIDDLRATVTAQNARMDRLTEALQASNALLAHHVQWDVNRQGENIHSLDDELYDLLPAAAYRTFAGKPLSAKGLKRELKHFFINKDCSYQLPMLHPVYKCLRSAFAMHDKEVCELGKIFAQGLCPLDEFLAHLPNYLECDPEVGHDIHDLLTCMYSLMFQGMAASTMQCVQYLEKEVKAAPGEYDNGIITNPKPFIEARDALAALTP